VGTAGGDGDIIAVELCALSYDENYSEGDRSTAGGCDAVGFLVPSG